nr:alpha/beta fold hydrolase [Clostridia bacterium]
MEILRIKVYLTGHIVTEGHEDTAVMLPFTGECDSPLFKGKILPGGVDTQRIARDGRGTLSARYTLEGVDDQGRSCRLFIDNTALLGKDGIGVTYPAIRTDSESLRWLENADLTGAIEHFPDHIEIVISSEDRPGVRHIALKRAGLTLRGVLEKKAEGPAPLVVMCHGFGGQMDAFPGGWFQEWSDMLTAAGFATLRFDFNGHGRSEGRFRDMTVFSEIEDAAAFLQYAMQLPDVTSVSLLGHSQGGVVAGMLAGYYHDRINKLVMLAPAASLKTDAINGHCMQADYDPQCIPDEVQAMPGCAVGGLYFRMAQMLPIYEVTGQFAGPALAVIAGADGVVFGGNIRRYGEVMPNCRVVEKATLNHGMFGEEKTETMQEVIAFLKGE